MFSLIRLAILLFTRRWGIIVVGIACIVFGLFYGILSHAVAYQRVGPTSVLHYLRTDSTGDAYVELGNSPTLYILHQSDFSPSLSGISFNDQSMVSVVYQTDSTTSIDETSSSGTVLKGDAYTIIEMTDSDGNVAYTTDKYNQNPNGYYENNWGGGIALFLLGVVMAGLAIFWPKIQAKRGKGGKGVATNTVAGTYTGYPNQPYQPTPGYPAYNQNTPYPGQPVPSVQPAPPSNPYANPYGGSAQYPPVPNPQYPQNPQYQQYQQYQPYQPGQPPQGQNPYSQHGQPDNPYAYPPYQQPQE